jgi:hypothetical protein
MKNPLIAGILVIVLLISFILSCGCISQETPQSTTTGGSMATPVKSTSHRGEPVDLNMQFDWDKNTGNPDVLTVSGTTNIPDGAGLWCSAYEGTNPDEYDSKFATASDPSIVKDGKFSCTLNLYDGVLEADFTDNTILFELSFMPSATLLQPQSITEYYERGALLKIKNGSPGFIRPGPQLRPEEKILYYQAFVTFDGDSSPKVQEVKDYFGWIR